MKYLKALGSFIVKHFRQYKKIAEISLNFETMYEIDRQHKVDRLNLIEGERMMEDGFIEEGLAYMHGDREPIKKLVAKHGCVCYPELVKKMKEKKEKNDG